VQQENIASWIGLYRAVGGGWQQNEPENERRDAPLPLPSKD